MPGSPRRRALFAVVLTAGFLLVVEAVANLLPTSLIAPREEVIRDLAGSEGLISSSDIPGWDIDPKGGDRWDTTYTTNRWRMRGPDHPAEKAPGVKRVIFVGDSSIFGVLLDWEETFSARFEAAREARDPGVDWQVANCACPGHSTEQSKRKLERHCLAFEPDYVVIGNQFSDSTRETSADIERFGLSIDTGASRLLERAAVYRLFRNVWLRNRGADLMPPQEIAQVGLPQPGKVRRVPVPDYERNLRTMVDMVRDAGATPVFLMLAAINDLPPNPSPAHSAEYREAMRRVADDEGIPLADAPTRYQSLPPAEGMFADHVHPGPLGALTLGLLLDETIPR